MEKLRVRKVWVDDVAVNVMAENSQTASYRFSQWQRLANATPQQRENFYLTYGGIHWPEIDEDLSFEGMFHAAGLCERTDSEDSVYWQA